MQHNPEEDKIRQGLVSVISKLLLIILVLIAGLIAMVVVLFQNNKPQSGNESKTGATSPGPDAKKDTTVYWTANDLNTVTDAGQKAQLEYGKALIAHTAKYLGPLGSVKHISNGMNCQNCHLDAGTKIWGNNYGSVASLYPKLRARSGKVENIYKRVNDCFERSLNGKALDSNSKEMQAIATYINFIGSNVEKGKKAAGSGFKDLPFLDRAADPEKGRSLYSTKCQSCHQANGEGVFNADKTEYTYPALLGKNSFNDGAGLFRISNFAKYIKNNMPLGVTYATTQLSDEEAWDLAAFVVSQNRPHLDVPQDWPDITKKPVDHPFGPYADQFSEKQHKYGPFKPIVEEQKKREESAKQKSGVSKK